METVSWEDREGVRWIAVEGELDHEGCLVIRDRFHDAVAEGKGDVVVSLAGVTFLSSMGVGMLLKARESLTRAGRQLKLNGLTPPVRRALELMNLQKVFEEI